MPESLPRPDARTLRRSAALESAHASEVLWAAGDLLRASDAEGHVEARAALARITPLAAQTAIAEVDVASCARAMEEALEEAFEAGLEDDAELREQLELSTMDHLEQRDVVECVLLAVTTFDGRGDVDPREAASLREAASSLRAAVLAADARVRPRGRTLTALNERRRARAGELDDVARAGAWWWSERADEAHDGLLELLAGRDVEAGAAAREDAGRGAILGEREAFGAALRAIDDPSVGPLQADAARWAARAAERRPADAIALELTRTLDVEKIDDNTA